MRHQAATLTTKMQFIPTRGLICKVRYIKRYNYSASHINWSLTMKLFLQFLGTEAMVPAKCARHIVRRHSNENRNASVFFEDIFSTLQEASTKTAAKVLEKGGKLICDVMMDIPVGHRNHEICKTVRFVLRKKKNVIITAYPV